MSNVPVTATDIKQDCHDLNNTKQVRTFGDEDMRIRWGGVRDLGHMAVTLYLSFKFCWVAKNWYSF